MKYVVTGSEMLRIDEFTTNVMGIPQMVLMERAAIAVFEYIDSHFETGARVLVAVESGNNGGDGIAVARMLMQAGYDVEIYWINGLKSASQGFDNQYAIAKKMYLKFVDEIVDSGYDVVVDGIFGVGLNRAVTGVQAETIKALNDIKGYKIAIDIPSGVDAQTGFVLGVAFRADTTITFGYKKLGLLLGMGYEYSGEVVVADIGFPKQSIDFVQPRLYTYDKEDVDRLLPYRKSDSHKGSYGKIGVIAGSKNMAGACLFAAESAYRMGCGLVRVCTVEENREIIQTKLPEAMLTTYDMNDKASIREAIKSTTDWADIIILGPGLSKSEYAAYIVEKVLRNYEETVIVDADALNIIAENKDFLENANATIIMTPHLVEMSRLTGMKVSDIKENKYDLARDFAKRNGVVIALKDSRTVVSEGEFQAYINTTGNNGMATGGSGDALTGIIAGLLGQGMTAFEATKLGVCLHGLAGEKAAEEKGRYSMIAGDIVRSINAVLEADYN